MMWDNALSASQNRTTSRPVSLDVLSIPHMMLQPDTFSMNLYIGSFRLSSYPCRPRSLPPRTASHQGPVLFYYQSRDDDDDGPSISAKGNGDSGLLNGRKPKWSLLLLLLYTMNKFRPSQANRRSSWWMRMAGGELGRSIPNEMITVRWILQIALGLLSKTFRVLLNICDDYDVLWDRSNSRGLFRRSFVPTCASSATLCSSDNDALTYLHGYQCGRSK